MKKILKRIFASSVCLIFFIGIISNYNIVLAQPYYYSPNDSASLPTGEVGNYNQWRGAVGTGEARTFSNNSYQVEDFYYLYQFQIKKTAQTTLTVTKGTSCDVPDRIDGLGNTAFLNLSDDAKTNFKWFKIKEKTTIPGSSQQQTYTRNTANNIQVKVSNLKIFQTDDNGNNGKWISIDMVRTITSMTIYEPTVYSNANIRTGYQGDVNYVALGYGICDTIYIGLNDVKTNNQFYYSGTNTPINLKTNITLYDVDADQYVGFKNGNIIRHYLTRNTALFYDKRMSTYENSYIYRSPETEFDGVDQRVTVGFILNGSSLEYTFGRLGSHASYATKQEQFLGTLNNMSGFTPVNPTKTITDSDETNVTSNNIRSIGESWTYNIEQTIPEVNASNFSSFSLSDNIDACLDFDRSDISIEATNGINTIDATSWFNITSVHYGTDHGYYKVNVALKDSYVSSLNSDFYDYQTYRLKIPVKISGSLNSSASGSFMAKMARVGHANEQRTKLNFTNIASSYINGEQRDTNEVNTTVNLPTKSNNTPGLLITKNADYFEYQVGDKVHYTVEVSNTNPEADTAYFIVKDDTMPSSMSIDPDSFNISGINSSNYNFEISGNNWQLSSKGDYALPYGTTLKIEFDATALKPSNSHLIDNTASAWAYGVGEDQSAEEIWVNSPKLNITKTADKTKFNLGDTINYTIEATNVNEGTLAQVVFEDTLPVSGLIVSDSVKVMGDDTDITNNCTITLTNNNKKLSIDGRSILKNGDCELSNARDSRVAMLYRNGFAPRSYNKITITYQVKIPNADITNANAISITDQKILENTVKVLPTSLYPRDGDYIPIKEDSTIPSGGDDDSASVTINDPELSVTKSSNKEAYKVGNTVNYTITIKQTNPNLIARNITLTDTLEENNGITVDKDSIKVFLNNTDITNTCLIIKNSSSIYTNNFFINTQKSISDQDEIKISYNATANKTGYYENNVSVNSSNTPSVTDDNEIEVQVNGLPMTGQERNLFFIFIGISILLTITIVIVRKKTNKDLIH